jgi:AraC family transcriptional regulator of adaptative response / DNA-3-methyladenine glycosylase II
MPEEKPHSESGGTRLDDEACYAALRARDRRFDGLFFVGISTTGIYCRSVCSARAARRSSCTFYPSAAAAEAEGYRPCMRCRPELAPGRSHYSGGYAGGNGESDARYDAVEAAIARIRAGAMNGGSVAAVAAETGLSERHLRRVVREATGASPVQIAQTSRLLLAKQLLTDSRLAITRVASVAGFSSLRRFNEAFLEAYGMAPTRFRRGAGGVEAGAHDGAIVLRVGLRPPYSVERMVQFLRWRVIAGVDVVEDDAYARTVELDGKRGWFRARIDVASHACVVTVSRELLGVLRPLLAGVRDLFDLDARPEVIDGHLAASPVLARHVLAVPGVRVPGAFDAFEVAWRAVLGQQVSVKAATTLAGRLAERFGEPVVTPFPELSRLSPTAARIASARDEEVAGIGLPRTRAATLKAIAGAFVREPQLLRPGQDPARVREKLLELPGIGAWTAEYLSMRALRWPDAFPGTDLGIKKALEACGERESVSAAWSPWRAYAAMRLWAMG